jgi:transcriptional regulator with XRE-family HTH domain
MTTDTTTSTERRFVERVKALRAERGWTQGQLAERMVAAGVDYASQSTVSRLEQGGRPIRLVEAQALAVIFNSTIWQLTADEPRVQMLSYVDLNLRAFTRDRMAYREARRKLEILLPDVTKMLHDLDRDFPRDEVGLSPDAVERVENLRENLRRQIELATADLRAGDNPFFDASGNGLDQTEA